MTRQKSSLSRRAFIQIGAGMTMAAACRAEQQDPQAKRLPVAGDRATSSSELVAAENEELLKKLQIDQRPFKAALIGCGEQGRRLMTEAAKVPGFTFTALCDILPDNLQAAQAIAGDKAKSFTDYKALLKDGDFQGVLIATPLHLHHAMTIDALKGGRPVLVERMMADTLERCKEMVVAALGSGDKLMTMSIGTHLRYHPHVSVAAKFLVNNELRNLKRIQCAWNQPSLRRPPTKAPAPDLKAAGYADPDRLLNWRLYKEHSGGIMTEVANDQLDAVNLILGDKNFPKAVTGKGSTQAKDGRTIIDTVELEYQYEDGKVVTYQSHLDEKFAPAGWEAMMVLEGENGRIVLAHRSPFAGLFFIKPNAEKPLWYNLAVRTKAVTDPKIIEPGATEAVVLGKPTPGTIFVSGNDAYVLLDPKTNQPLLSSYVLELHDFKRSVLDAVMPQSNGLTGLRATAMSLYGLEAAQKNTTVTIPESAFTL
jgi:predicted dehydrogenase